ncbi:MAG: D-arabinono-1,4-lactone oxidase [Cyclobacteriaceae bacterium]
MKNNIWVGWNKIIQHPYKELYEIKTEEDLSTIISKSDSIRFFGSKQSSADICAGVDILLDMRSYNKILAIDDSSLSITVESGFLLSDLLEKVESKGWCIPCLPDINTITVGGAFATGTHGTSGHLLAQHVSSCRLVLADGSIKTVSEGDELMDALRVSLGTLGVISTLTFKCEPTYTLHVKEGPQKDTTWLKNIQSDLKKHDFLRILWLPHTGNGYVITGDKISPNKEITTKNGPSYLKYRRTVSKFLYQFTSTLPWFTSIANKILYAIFFKSEKEHKGSLYQATVTKSRGSTIELSEWTIGLDKFPQVFEELKTEINKWSNKAFIHIPMDVRFVYADNSWLSYAYKKDVVTMGCVSRVPATADNYEAFHTIERIFVKHGGTPHWGKRFTIKDKELSKLYPKWNDFKKLRKNMDPTNKFLNPYLKELFNEKA